MTSEVNRELRIPGADIQKVPYPDPFPVQDQYLLLHFWFRFNLFNLLWIQSRAKQIRMQV